MEQSSSSPLHKVIFLQRIAKFAGSSPKKIVKLCYVSSTFRQSIISYDGFLQLLLKPFLDFPSHIFLLPSHDKTENQQQLLFGMSNVKTSSLDEALALVKSECNHPTVADALKHAKYYSTLFSHRIITGQSTNNAFPASCNWDMREWKKICRIIFWALSKISSANQEILDRFVELLKFIKDEHYKENVLNLVLKSYFFHWDSFNKNVQDVGMYLAASKNKHNPNFFEHFIVDVFPTTILHPRFYIKTQTENTNDDKVDFSTLESPSRILTKPNSTYIDSEVFASLVAQVKVLLEGAASAGSSSALRFLLDPTKKIMKFLIDACYTFVEMTQFRSSSAGNVGDYILTSATDALSRMLYYAYKGVERSGDLDTMLVWHEMAIQKYPEFQRAQEEAEQERSSSKSPSSSPCVKFFKEKMINVSPSHSRIRTCDILTIFTQAVERNQLELVKTFLYQDYSSHDDDTAAGASAASAASPKRFPFREAFDIRAIAYSSLNNRRYTFFLLAIQFGSVDVVRFVLEELFPPTQEGRKRLRMQLDKNHRGYYRRSAIARDLHLYEDREFGHFEIQRRYTRVCVTVARRDFPKENPFHLLARLNTKPRSAVSKGFKTHRIPSGQPKGKNEPLASVEIAKLIVEYCKKEREEIQREQERNPTTASPFYAFGAPLETLLNQQNGFGCTPKYMCLKRAKYELAEYLTSTGLIITTRAEKK